MATLGRRIEEAAAAEHDGDASHAQSKHDGQNNGEMVETSGVQVASAAAEAFISEKRIGERIKYLRLKKGMGLVELGRHTGLSASFLSQLETGRVVPTLRNLARIAMVFSKDLSYFFEPEPQAMLRIHRAKDRVRTPQTGVEDPDYYFESLGYLVPERGLNPYFAEFLPHKPGREPRAHQHAGSEFLYVLSGAMDLRHGECTYHIDAGDAVYFDASTSHTYICASDEPAHAVIVTMQGNTAQQHTGPGVRPASIRTRTAVVPGAPNGSGPGEGSSRIAS